MKRKPENIELIARNKYSNRNNGKWELFFWVRKCVKEKNFSYLYIKGSHTTLNNCKKPLLVLHRRRQSRRHRLSIIVVKKKTIPGFFNFIRFGNSVLKTTTGLFRVPQWNIGSVPLVYFFFVPSSCLFYDYMILWYVVCTISLYLNSLLIFRECMCGLRINLLGTYSCYIYL